MVSLTRETITMPRVSHVDRIVADIRARIESGEWPPGHRLPSIARMKVIYECSEQPIKAAERVLAATGWIEGHPGVGVFVAQEPPKPVA